MKCPKLSETLSNDTVGAPAVGDELDKPQCKWKSVLMPGKSSPVPANEPVRRKLASALPSSLIVGVPVKLLTRAVAYKPLGLPPIGAAVPATKPNVASA